MTRCRQFLITALALGVTTLALGASDPSSSRVGDHEALTQVVERLDAAVFDAFNKCADPAELQRHASYFSEDTESYHDNAGVTWNRADMLKNTAAHACGRYTRQLVLGSLKVTAIRGFGAVSIGTHRFCDMAGAACAGEADFVMLWREREGHWVVTRTLSFGHRRAEEAGLTTPLIDTAAVDRIASQHQVESVSLALLRDGRHVLSYAAGRARQGVPATVGTLYNIASLAKPISAEVALRLAARGDLALDERLSSHWLDPDLATDPRADQLTAELVLSHRTGLPNWRQGALRFERNPGEAFGYSGEGFELLARFIEAKTARRLDDWAEQLVFVPLGMRETSYTGQPWFGDRVALPHDAQGRPLPADIRDRAIASDDVFSTPTDYARFIEALMRESAAGTRLAALRTEVRTDRRQAMCQALPVADCPAEAGFALGWESFLIDGKRYLMHTGSDLGTFTFAYFSPDTRSGAVLFMNSSRGAEVVLPVLRLAGADQRFVGFLDDLVRRPAH